MTTEYWLSCVYTDYTRRIFEDIHHLEFCNDFVIIQYWDGTCETVDSSVIEALMIFPKEGGDD